MAVAPRKSSSVITYKPKDTIALPPMVLGYSNLIDPETFDPDKPKLTMNGHLTPAGIEAMKELVLSKVYTPAALDKLRAECAANNVKGVPDEPMSAEKWLESKLKEPKEGFAIQLPFLKLENNYNITKFNRVTKEREKATRSIACWDGHNNKLNLAKLRLGRESVVEAIVYPNLYFAKIGGVIAPSLKLVGIRVLELKQFMGNSQPSETSDEEIRNVLGRDIQAEDLSAYALGEPDDDEDEVVTANPKAPPAEQDPADRAKGMF